MHCSTFPSRMSIPQQQLQLRMPILPRGLLEMTHRSLADPPFHLPLKIVRIYPALFMLHVLRKMKIAVITSIDECFPFKARHFVLPTVHSQERIAMQVAATFCRPLPPPLRKDVNSAVLLPPVNPRLNVNPLNFLHRPPRSIHFNTINSTSFID